MKEFLNEIRENFSFAKIFFALIFLFWFLSFLFWSHFLLLNFVNMIDISYHVSIANYSAMIVNLVKIGFFKVAYGHLWSSLFGMFLTYLFLKFVFWR
jgi:hypothetical protein